jgi:uncharacterized membrane protein
MLDSTHPANTSKMIYILYLVNIVIPLLAIIGLIMAYINRDDSVDWLRSHYDFQIRTFWISILYSGISLILSFIFIGYLLLFATFIWYVVRCAKGLKYLGNGMAYPEPKTWSF